MPESNSTLEHLEAGTVASYLDGRLSPSVTAEVESHLAECPSCRREIVELEDVVRPRRRGRRVYLAGLAAAAAAALLIVGFPRALRMLADSAQVQPNSARIRELGRVAQAPIYLGVSVRAASEQGTRLFTTGMSAYNAARYTNAVTDLLAARAAGVAGPAATFFLASSHLMLGDASSAADEFARVIAMGQTSYLPEAHYYRAKALLRLDRAREAVTELERSVQTGDDSTKTIARSLRDSLRLLGAQ